MTALKIWTLSFQLINKNPLGFFYKNLILQLKNQIINYERFSQ